MKLDQSTEQRLELHRRLRADALANGNELEADALTLAIDRILDERPRPIAVAADGEILYDNQSSWVLAQATHAVDDTRVINPALGLDDVAGYRPRHLKEDS